MDVMENDLNQVIQNKKFTLREILNVFYCVTMGLNYLHSFGIVHCDVKPSNVMFKDGRPKLGDLSAARFQDLTIDREVFGEKYCQTDEQEYITRWYLSLIHI